MPTRTLALTLPLLALLVPGCRSNAADAHAPVDTAGPSTPTVEVTKLRAGAPREGVSPSPPAMPVIPMASAAPADIAVPPAAPRSMTMRDAPAPLATAPGKSDGWRTGALGASGDVAGAGGAPAVAAAPPARMEATRAWQGGGSIKAGEWDDNANYHEFQRYLADEETLPIHRVDVSDRQFLVVRDADGKAVPRCRVTVSDASQHEITLTTTASGRALLFPHGERLGGTTLSAVAGCAGATAHAQISLAQGDGVVDLKLASRRELPATPTIDVAFILDTTGSMSEEIDAVKSTIGKVTSSLRQQNVAVRIGLVEYKDRTDPFVTKVYPISSNVDHFLTSVAGLEAGGGGDTPESVNEGIHVALTKLAWSTDSVGRFAFLIGDAPPHLDYPNDADYAVDMRDAAHRGIQVFTIAASGMDGLGQAVWRQIAQYTDATNMFVMRGGAGPQSVGAGDPKSSCGGTQTQYASGNLDVLIVSKVQHELKGLDRDPMRIAGLHGDENAKSCAERVALD
jgi:hypothetical protein